MRGLESRLKRLEQQIPPPRSPGERPPWRTPEQHAERERRFEELYRELGLPWPTAPRDPEQVRARLFDVIEKHREVVERKVEA
jgi:hypothetical protein